MFLAPVEGVLIYTLELFYRNISNSSTNIFSIFFHLGVTVVKKKI
jgi:hypothetical protein